MSRVCNILSFTMVMCLYNLSSSKSFYVYQRCSKVKDLLSQKDENMNILHATTTVEGPDFSQSQENVSELDKRMTISLDCNFQLGF